METKWITHARTIQESGPSKIEAPGALCLDKAHHVKA